jgi:hypothetical protein
MSMNRPWEIIQLLQFNFNKCKHKVILDVNKEQKTTLVCNSMKYYSKDLESHFVNTLLNRCSRLYCG